MSGRVGNGSAPERAPERAPEPESVARARRAMGDLPEHLQRMTADERAAFAAFQSEATAQKIDRLIDDSREWAAVVGNLAAKVDASQVDARDACSAVMAMRSDFVTVRDDVDAIKGGLLECLAIVRAEQTARKQAAADARASDAAIDERSTMTAAEVQRLKESLAPFVVRASRESSAKASKQVGAYGAIATTVGVLAPHVPWSEIGHALSSFF